MPIDAVDTRSARGFRQYAFGRDMYEAEISVHESSSVEPAIWLSIAGGHVDKNKGSALLSPADAFQLGLELIKAAQEKTLEGIL